MSQSFSALGIRTSFQQGLTALGITTPTDIQAKVIPKMLSSTNDVVALAKTGTGKTAAFGLPLLQKIETENATIQAVVLAPTRELGHQIYDQIVSYAANDPAISIASLCGGIPIKPQIERLKLDTHLIIATPGRLVDLIERGAIDLSNVNSIVLDEADEMITAHKDTVELILKKLPKSKRTLLFTATLSGAIRQLTNDYLSKKVTQLEADMKSMGHQGIDHQYVVVEPIEKLQVLLHFLNSRAGEQGIIFCKTKAAVNKLAKNLVINKFSSGALHGSLSQPIRDRVMGQFRDGHIDLLVATDLAARGLDVKDIGYVVNYHLPDTYETYVHRSGRTARAGKKGMSLTVLQEDEVAEVADFSEALGITFSEMRKADAQSIEDNNTLLWARKVFKTKPNRDLSETLKTQVKTVFHHLTKDELIEKVLAYQVASNPSASTTKHSK